MQLFADVPTKAKVVIVIFSADCAMRHSKLSIDAAACRETFCVFFANSLFISPVSCGRVRFTTQRGAVAPCFVVRGYLWAIRSSVAFNYIALTVAWPLAQTLEKCLLVELAGCQESNCLPDDSFDSPDDDDDNDDSNLNALFC